MPFDILLFALLLVCLVLNYIKDVSVKKHSVAAISFFNCEIVVMS